MVLPVAATSHPRPAQPALRAFAQSIGVARSRVRLGTQIRTRQGVAVRLWIVRGYTASDLCATIQVASRRPLATACGGVAPAVGSAGIVLGPATEGGRGTGRLVGGLAARSTAKVRLQFADGSTIRVPARSGAWLVEIPRSPSSRGRLLHVTTEPRSG